MRLFLLTLYIYIGSTMCAFCQTDTQEEKRMAWEDFVTVMMEEMDEEDGLDEVMLERLEELYGNPMDINEAGKEDLEMLPFLSQEQVEGILRYRERNGRM
ncbi:MAG: helix-hairpin-helix domain-containing protein [Bacteroidaceae bacterium]|nr:helix-hairpin-helix domain-containing protein [Bacteroidaceae bacterium]